MQMFKYVLKRLAYSIVTLFVLVALTFFLQHMLPGDPFIGDKALPEATMEALRPSTAWTSPCPSSSSSTWATACGATWACPSRITGLSPPLFTSPSWCPSTWASGPSSSL